MHAWKVQCRIYSRPCSHRSRDTLEPHATFSQKNWDFGAKSISPSFFFREVYFLPMNESTNLIKMMSHTNFQTTHDDPQVLFHSILSHFGTLATVEQTTRHLGGYSQPCSVCTTELVKSTLALSIIRLSERSKSFLSFSKSTSRTCTKLYPGGTPDRHAAVKCLHIECFARCVYKNFLFT